LPAVELRRATLAYGSRVLWRDLDLTVHAGEFIAVLGPNGSGKTSLLRVLLGQQRLVSGTVRVAGAPPGRVNRHVGYIPQQRALEPSRIMRGRDLVGLGWDGHRWGTGVSRIRDRRRRVDAALAAVGAAGYADAPVGQLSGGEQQRLIIAQALAKGPNLLLLDEPLDNLDISNQAIVAALIQRICRERGIAVVMVAHDVNPILPYIDQVIYLAGGSAVSGTPEEVITSETLSALYRTRVEVLRSSDGRLVVVGQPEAPSIHTERHDR
jgi:zinc/manganese transport system ATP-binding protein